MLVVADWAHYSWLDRSQPARNERARAEASAQLLGQYPQLAEAATAQLPWFSATLSRPAFARLARLSAALARAQSLRLVVTAQARTELESAMGACPVTALQCHPCANRSDLRFDAPVDLFNRHTLTAAGLAILMRASSGAGQRLWLQLRLPREYAQAAARWRLPDVAPQAALELVGEAMALLEARRRAC